MRRYGLVPFTKLTFSIEDDEDDIDMDAYADDFKVIPKSKLKSYEIDYESLSQKAIAELMQSDVDHIIGIFGVDVSRIEIYHAGGSLTDVTGKHCESATAVHVVEQRTPD